MAGSPVSIFFRYILAHLCMHMKEGVKPRCRFAHAELCAPCHMNALRSPEWIGSGMNGNWRTFELNDRGAARCGDVHRHGSTCSGAMSWRAGVAVRRSGARGGVEAVVQNGRLRASMVVDDGRLLASMVVDDGRLQASMVVKDGRLRASIWGTSRTRWRGWAGARRLGRRVGRWEPAWSVPG